MELFLSGEDFEGTFMDFYPEKTPTTLDAHLVDIEMDSELRLPMARRVNILAYKALWLSELGRTDDALRTVEEAERGLTTQLMTPWERASALRDVVQGKLNVLVDGKRTQEALAYAAIVDPGPEGDPMLRYAVTGALARLYDTAGRVAESLACSAEALTVGLAIAQTAGGQATHLINRSELLARQGDLDDAVRDAIEGCRVVDSLRARSERDEAVRPYLLYYAEGVQARVCLERGDTLHALGHAHRGVTRMVGLAAKRPVREALGQVADMYRLLGLADDARRFAHRAIELLAQDPGDVAWWTRWLGAHDADERQIDAAITNYESALSLYGVAAQAERGPHRRASWLRDAAAVLYDDLAPLTDPPTAARHFSAAADLLTLASLAATEAASPEQHALTQQSRASLAAARKQWDIAETELLAFYTWAEANWGPYKRADVLLDLARMARERGDLPRAATYAERAQREVAIDPPEYYNRFTAIAAARELARIRKAQGDLTAAHAALGSALAITEGDKLRLREREVRIDLAELPPLPGARDARLEHAQRARTIAQDAAFPVDEAEAMLVLAELHLDAGGARRARALFDQSVWIVDRIGPAALRERAARVRAKLEG